MHIIPTTVVDAFARGDILEVVFVSVLFGFGHAMMGKRVKPLVDVIEGLTQAVFGVVNIVMKAAPIGAFGAMAFTDRRSTASNRWGRWQSSSATFWITSILFVLVVLGAICWASGFRIFRFLRYIKEEIVLCLTLSSSEPALPTLDGKDGEAGLLEGAGRAGRAHRIHLQHRWQQHLHDPGGAVRGAGHEHSPHARRSN